MTCLSIVTALHYLYRAAVSALFSLVVLLIMYCVVKLHFILLFEQIKKERKKEREKSPTSASREFIVEIYRYAELFIAHFIDTFATFSVHYSASRV